VSASSSAVRRTSAAVAKEIRVSVVMYGGVSLAIYMNGVAQELLHMVRSTARMSSGDAAGEIFRFCDEKRPNDPSAPSSRCKDKLRSTERIYRDLARALNEPGLDDVRFIIDVISGTSAGGINGIFLGKALTDDSLSFDTLKSLWVEEGALEKLLNDPQTHRATGLPEQKTPKSLLCSDRMYVKLLQAFGSMKTGTGTGETLTEEMDMFATTTDIQGRVIPLRLADMLVWERKYKQDFHFRYESPKAAGAGTNDFKEENNPFLAFVARCTSSFPFAFEPMQLSRVSELSETEAWPKGVNRPQELSTWESFFDHTDQLYTGSNLNRAFGDGGYLNNAPFSYVVQMLGRHDSPYPTDRKLMYVEPSPAHPEDEATTDAKDVQDKKNAPNALANAYDALVKLPDAQPIHDDLQRVIERNRLVRKVIELSKMVTANIYQQYAESQKCCQLNPRSIGDFSYLAARVYATTDDLAKVMSQWFEFPDTSSFYYGVRCIVKAWRDTRFNEETQGAENEPPAEGQAEGQTATKLGSRAEKLATKYIEFLEDYDADYPKRLYRFVRQQVNQFYPCDDAALAMLSTGFGIRLNSDSERKDFQRALIEAKKPFDDAHRMIGDTLRKIRPAVPGARPMNMQVRLDPTQDGTYTQQPLAKSVVDYVLGTPPWATEHKRKARPDTTSTPHETELEKRFLDLLKSVDLFRSNNEAARLESPGVAEAEEIERYKGQDGGAKEKRTSDTLSVQDDENYMKRAYEVLPFLGVQVEAFAKELSETLKSGMKAAEVGVKQRLAAWHRDLPQPDGADDVWATRGGQNVYKFVRFFHDCFEQFDTGIFPLTYETDVSTPELVSIVRISPDDATGIFDIPPRTQKLAGATLAHFGAFLDRSFRTNDILWGRLDGAERIIHSMMASAQTNNLVERAKREKQLIEQAQTIILEDFLEERKQEFAGVLFEVGKSMGARLKDEKAQVDQALANIKATLDALPAQPFKNAVLGFLNTDQMRRYLECVPVKREPDRQTTLESITRSVRIVGGMLGSLSDQTKGAGKWVARLGDLLWVIVQAAVPGALAGHFFSHIVALLFWIEAVIFVGGSLFNHALEVVGLKLLLVTGLVWLAQNSLMHYVLRGVGGARKQLVASALIGLLAVVLIFAIVFGIGPWASGWLHQHWHLFSAVPSPAV
jgi:patatin-related protein